MSTIIPDFVRYFFRFTARKCTEFKEEVETEFYYEYDKLIKRINKRREVVASQIRRAEELQQQFNETVENIELRRQLLAEQSKVKFKQQQLFDEQSKNRKLTEQLLAEQAKVKSTEKQLFDEQSKTRELLLAEQSMKKQILNEQSKNRELEQQLSAEQSKNVSLQQQLDAKDECCICMDEEPVYAMVPCGHHCVCEDCKNEHQIKECPICRTKVDSLLKVYA